MAMDPVIPIGGNVEVQPADFRRAVIGSTMAHDRSFVACRAGVVSGLSVTQSGVGVSVAPGCAVVTPRDSNNGSYWVSLGNVERLPLQAHHQTYDRVDLIVIRVYDSSVDSSGKYVAAAEVVAGTPAPSPVTPSTPSGALLLATVYTSNNGTISIGDNREYTSTVGGVIPISSSFPSGAAVRPGQMVFLRDRRELYVWSGSAWEKVSQQGGLPKVPAMASGTVTVGTGGSQTAVVQFPYGRFSSTPIVVACINSGSGDVNWNAVKVYNVTNTSFGVFSNTGLAAPINWIAMEQL
jgi:hypothetical protein